MPNTIVTIHADAGLDVYGILWHADGTVRDVVAGAWDAVLNADWGDYDIAAAVAANGSYQVTFPVVAAGAYTLEIYSRLGETVSPYDSCLQRIPVEWDGSVILPLATVDTVADAILADTGTDGVVVAAASKTGYALSATGLDTISTSATTGLATTLPTRMNQLWRRFFRKATKTSTQIKTYADNGTDVLTTQTVSDDDVTETQGAGS